jgi:murein DD-endopeptidase MepM/ murein hydrolase activator NlpD
MPFLFKRSRKERAKISSYKVPGFFEKGILLDLKIFTFGWWVYLSVPTKKGFFRFENIKGMVAEGLYRQRGKFARPFVHSGMVGICAFGVMLAPIVSENLPGRNNPWQIAAPGIVLSATTENPDISTTVSQKVRDLKTIYIVKDGDTLGSIAKTYGLTEQTVMWANDLNKKSVLKPGNSLIIPPEDGVLHKVEKGETIYSIAKKYDAEPQPMVDFPFNTYVNDETFALAIGQEVWVPNGVMPNDVPAPGSSGLALRRQTPNAGAVTASGSFVWPTQGLITQGFSWYHTGVDIANRAAPDILAVDSGTVVQSGWPDNSGYGMRVVIDHGNGLQTLYAHVQQVYVKTGQTVKRGDSIGQMGNTGRSTGTHLHFEVRNGGNKVNPLDYLK